VVGVDAGGYNALDLFDPDILGTRRKAVVHLRLAGWADIVAV
jgi:hypothetical protein